MNFWSQIERVFIPFNNRNNFHLHTIIDQASYGIFNEEEIVRKEFYSITIEKEMEEYGETLN